MSKTVKVAKMSDVLGDYDYAEVVNPLAGNVVRKLTRNGDSINLDAITEAIDIPADTPLGYTPWTFDRGNITFNGNLKLCTEMDTVRYPDGSEGVLMPDESIVPEPEPVDMEAVAAILAAVDDSPKGSEMVCSFDDDSIVPNPR